MQGRLHGVLAWVAVLATSTASCVMTSAVCTTEPRYSIIAQIQDSVSTTSLVEGSNLRLRSGSSIDSSVVILPASDGRPARVAIGQNADGVFSLDVSRAGYRNWSKSNIEVSRDQCGGVKTVALLVRLQRE